MRLLALIGSLMLLVYFVGLIALTFHNISKGAFALETGEPRLVRFFMRQIMILLWPLVLCSEEGPARARSYLDWKGRHLMKKAIVLCALAVSACSYAAPDAGEQAVLVRKPWFFGSGGVDMTPVSTGSKIVASSTDVVKVSVTPTAFDVPFDNLMPSNGIPLDFHTTVRLQVTDAPALVRDWNGAARNEKGDETYYWFYGSIQPVYANMVRQEVKNYDMSALAFNGAAIDAIDAKVSAQLAEFIRKNKMPVRLLSVTIGRATPPQEILNQRTETAAQQQRELTMVAQQKAEAARKGAEQARAEADNAYRAEMQLTPEQYVELKKIEMQRTACSHGTCIFGNATPIINR